VGPRLSRTAQQERREQEERRRLNVRNRIIDVYSKAGFDSIDPADLRGRFRWYGLYTQRRPGIDGGKTAILEPEELDDRYFMLRVRITGASSARTSCARSRTCPPSTRAAPPT
jgi:Sulfite reductase, beta subunit (hemoprotein)